ncbi:hypothetical protein [Fluviicola sp.]|uniref:RHS repeat domain-containing protein n=1 Tax=Fluviicola sp. TaxID=1917219 RepID=UPI0031D232E5
MKTHIFSLLLIFLCKQLNAQELILNAENLQSAGLRGKVKKVKETSFTASKTANGVVKSVKGWQYDFEYDSESFFDTLGNMTLENKLNLDKKEVTYSIKYDKPGRISVINRRGISYHFTYDSLNRISSSDKTDLRVKTAQPIHFSYSYNAENRLIRSEEFLGDASVSVETFQYNAAGKLIARELKHGTNKDTHLYTYNADQLLAKEEWSDNVEGILEITTYVYKNKEKVLEHWVDFEDGQPDGYIDDTFENGNIVLSAEVETDGTVSYPEQCTYELDSHGNWIKKIIQGEEGYFIVERVIEYY